MESIVNTFSYEMEYGGPHVHFLACLLFIFIALSSCTASSGSSSKC